MAAERHQPVLLTETLAAMGVRPGGRYADLTVGLGGHASAILEASAPAGWLLGCDRDPAALRIAGERLARFSGRFELRQGNFADVAARAEFSCFDGVLIDCGVNSTQLDEGGRGFSFRCDAPLDMRLDPGQALTAAAWVNGTPVEEMAATFRELGDVPGARRLARAIERARRAAPLTTTGQLAELAARVAPRGAGRIHPATRLFMAVRMRINEEIESLERGLEAAWGLLRPGGVLAVIGFCSPEHRVVKAFGRERARDYATPGGVDVPELRQPRAPSLRWITRKAVAPGAEELERNPRARSAQLRAMMKLTETGEAAHG